MSNIEEIINRQIHNWDRIQSVLGKRPASEDEPGEEDLPPRQPVIAFSRELGCGSRRVTARLSQRTGFEIYGCSLIERVAEDIQVRRRIIDRLDERARSRTEAFLEGLMMKRHVDRVDYFRSLVSVVRALIEQGGVILLGRGTHFMLKENSGLRVRLIAPVEKRIENLMEFYEIDRDKAAAMMKKSDIQREDYVRLYFDKDIKDPVHYDLSINLGSVDTRTAVEIIQDAFNALR